MNIANCNRALAQFHEAIDSEVFDNGVRAWDHLEEYAQMDLAVMYGETLPLTHPTQISLIDIISESPELASAAMSLIMGSHGRFWLEDREKARHALLEAVAEEVAAAVQAAVLRFDSSKLFDGENLADDLISERRSSV
jgi:nucleotide-binding universal stress UspA family protein